MKILNSPARAVLWDLDGTLVDSEPAHQLSFINGIRELGLNMPDRFEARVLGLSERQIHVMLREEAGLELDLPDWRTVKWRHFRAEADLIQTREETVRAFRMLEAQKFPMAVVSNSTRDELNFNLRSASLEAGMSARVSVQDVSMPKPAPEGYLSAAAQLGIAAADCVVVEDTVPGSCAGLDAGMRVIFHPQHKVNAADIPGEVIALEHDAPLWPTLAGILMSSTADNSLFEEDY